MRVTIVDEELPFPLVTGKRIRISNLVSHLAKRHQITFICHRNSDRDEAQEAERYFRDQGVRTILVDRSRTAASRSKLAFAGRVAANLLSDLPYSVQWSACRTLQAAVARHATQHPVDLWQCEWAPYATALLPVRDARWVMMAHDIQSSIWERQHQAATNPLKRFYIWRQLQRYRQYERRVFAAAPLTITVTQQDARLAADEFGARRTAIVDNGVDVSHYQSFPGRADIHRQSNEILFLGNLEWRANADAVRTLIDDVFPQVLAEVPAARLKIVGRNPSTALRAQCQRRQNIELHANVADVRPFLYSAGAMAVPLRIGGGSRLKILEALACGLPVVSTGVGAEGLQLEPGRHFAKADGPSDMARTLTQWIADPRPGLAMAQAAQRIVAANYDWSGLADRMETAWHGVVPDSSSTKVTTLAS